MALTHEFANPLWVEVVDFEVVGEGKCYLILDYGLEEDTLFLVGMSETGELWWVPQSRVRLLDNYSILRRSSFTPPEMSPEVLEQAQLLREEIERACESG